jgi:hypothetical protein
MPHTVANNLQHNRHGDTAFLGTQPATTIRRMLLLLVVVLTEICATAAVQDQLQQRKQGKEHKHTF